MILCSLVGGWDHFEATYCLYLQGIRKERFHPSDGVSRPLFGSLLFTYKTTSCSLVLAGKPEGRYYFGRPCLDGRIHGVSSLVSIYVSMCCSLWEHRASETFPSTSALNRRLSVGLLDWGISQMQRRYVHTTTRTQNKRKHSRLEWDSILRSPGRAGEDRVAAAFVFKAITLVYDITRCCTCCGLMYLRTGPECHNEPWVSGGSFAPVS
jgi:hypothetical protein